MPVGDSKCILLFALYASTVSELCDLYLEYFLKSVFMKGGRWIYLT